MPGTAPQRLRFPSAPSSADEGTGFDHVPLAPAGATPRPPLDADVDDLVSTIDGLVRVLDDDGAAVGPWAGHWSRDELVRGLTDMVTVRTFDETMLRAHRQGATSFYMVSLGEEAIACAHRRALEARDMTFPTYRQQGLLVAAGYPLVDMMNQVLSNSRDPLKGRQLPVFYSSRQHGFFSISGNLGTQFVQSVGWAMAAAMSGTDGIASAWIGEGATAEPDFHSALLFAGTYQAPVVLNIVNNQWAISTPHDVARGASRTFAMRGLGYGIPALRVDGNDYLAVHAASRWAAERARRGHGPTLVEWVTYRAGAHSTSDDPSAYRSRDAWQAWPLGDPVERLAKHLRRHHRWTDHDHDALLEQVRATIAAAFQEAVGHGTVRDGPWADPGTMFDDVFARPTPHLLRQRAQAGV